MGQYIVYRPTDYIWVGPCKDFVQAFSTWLHVPDRDNWFIGRAEEHQLAIKGRGRWLKASDARPPRTERAPYRGPLSEKDIAERERRAKRERDRRARRKRS